MAGADADRNQSSEFQQLQKANNLAKAAYAEFSLLAFGEWIEDCQVDLSFLSKFNQTPFGKRSEFSVARVVLPISPSELRCILFDTSAWRALWPQIVHDAHSSLPSGVFQRLSEDSLQGSTKYPDEIVQRAGEWSSIIKVHARLLLPTPIVEIREYIFLRYQKEIMEGLWAIIDVSEDYYNDDSEAELKYRRRPSGIIVKEISEDECEVRWVENMEVPTPVQATLFLNMLDSNLAFTASQWVGTLYLRLIRQQSNLFYYDVEFASEYNMQQISNPHLGQCLRNQGMSSLNARSLMVFQKCQKVRNKLLDLTSCMEMKFFKTISAEPNENVWSIVFDERVRIMKDITKKQGSTLIAITSINVPAAPCLVYELLVQESLHLLKTDFALGKNKPKEVLRLSGGDCVVTLQRKLIKEGKWYDYFWQATQKSEFCSFIIAHEMIDEDISDIFSFRVATEKGKIKIAPSPVGFIIMPNGFGSLQSTASIVTIAMEASFYDGPEAKAITSIKNLISETRRNIEEIFTN